MKVLKMKENRRARPHAKLVIARRSKVKNTRNAGKKGTKWQCSGRRSKNWTEPWNEEGRRKLLKFGCHAKKVLELVVNERMSQDKKGDKSQRERRKYQGWPIEEMKEEPNVPVEEDTEEMRKWRGLSQSEMDQCWRNLAERKN